MKKILILVLLLFLTGCKARYDLRLDFDGTINESGTVYIDSNLLGKEDRPDDYKEFLDEIALQYKFSGYRSKKAFQSGGYFGYSFSTKYSNNRAYINQSPAINILFGGLLIKENNNYVVWQTTGANKISKYHNLKKDTPTVVESININITLPYRVVKHNADRVDSETNTYTWVLNGSSDKGIDLEFRNNELYSYNALDLYSFIGWYIYFIVIAIILAIVVFVSIRSNSKHANRV